MFRRDLRRQLAFQPLFLVRERVRLRWLTEERFLAVALAITSGGEEPQPIAKNAAAECALVNGIDFAFRTRLLQRSLRRPLRIGERVTQRSAEVVATRL